MRQKEFEVWYKSKVTGNAEKWLVTGERAVADLLVTKLKAAGYDAWTRTLIPTA